MNKIYKLKYDRRRNQLVAVSELTAGAGKETTGQAGVPADAGAFLKFPGTLTPLTLLAGLMMSFLPGMALANPALPTGGLIVQGQGSISTSTGGNQMTISQNTHGMVTNWNSFDIGANNTVKFVQPDSSSVALNRVTGGHESQILGTLTANGQVMLVNPAGVMFGKGAKVNTAGLVASTKNISNADFMAGRYTFSGGSQSGAEVVNQGNLTTSTGGYIVLAADRVKNTGDISTPGGKTVLAAGDRVTLQLDNTGLASVSVSGSEVNALVENSGLLSATNGQVYLTARGKDMLLNTVVNNSGTIEAKGLNSRGGEIILDGGDSGVVSQSGSLLADSAAGRGGKITVEGENIHLAANSRTSATGRTGGGEVYVGGGWQGKDGRIHNASKVVMDRAASVDVSATENGNGGTAVLWSEDYTNFRGGILAKGGSRSGNGGQVETSSHNNLQAYGDADASAPAGKGGNWLLDPLNIDINKDTHVKEYPSGVFTSAQGGPSVSNNTIINRLNSGTSVTIKTGTGVGDGDISVNADITKTGNSEASLTLDAGRSININAHTISSTGGKMDVYLYGAGSKNGGIALTNATINSNGGNIVLGRSPKAMTSGDKGPFLNINSTESTLTAGKGDITLSAQNNNDVAPVKLISSAFTGNNIEISGKKNDGEGYGVLLTANTLKADGNLNIGGVTSSHYPYATELYGVRVAHVDDKKDNEFSAGGNINITATAADGFSGALHLEGGSLIAPKVTLSGTATKKGAGVWVSGDTHVTGDLELSGNSTGVESGGNTSHHIADRDIDVRENTKIDVTGNLTMKAKGTVEMKGTPRLSVTAGSGKKTSIKSGGDLDISADSGIISFNTDNKKGSNLFIEAVGGVNIQARNGQLKMSANGTDNSVVSVKSGNGKDISLSGKGVGYDAIGLLLSDVKIESGSDVYLTGKTDSGPRAALKITQSSISANTTNGTIHLNGTTTGYAAASSGVRVEKTVFSAPDFNVEGVANKGTGFTITDSSFDGGHFTFSSEGSAADVTNVLGNGFVTGKNKESVFSNRLYNLTTVDMNDLSIFDNDYSGWTDDFTRQDTNSGFIFENAILNAGGTVNLQGANFKNSTISVNDGDFILNNSGPVILDGTNISAKNDINVNAGDGILTAKARNEKGETVRSNIKSTDGNISMTAHNLLAGKNERGIKLSGVDVEAVKGNVDISGYVDSGYGVELYNSSLRARKGYVEVKGTTDTVGDGFVTAGIFLSGPVTFESKNNLLNGIHNSKVSYTNSAGIIVGSSDIHFIGNSTVNATASALAGLLFNAGYGSSVKMTFEEGTSFINAKLEKNGYDSTNSGGISVFGWGNINRTIEFDVERSDLNIIATASNHNGFSSSYQQDEVVQGYVFSGNGNVTVKGVSDTRTGVQLNTLDNTRLNGVFTVIGESNEGPGIMIDRAADTRVFNAIVTGKSVSGPGIQINAEGVGSNFVVLNNNTLKGTSDTSSGILVSGNNVSVTDGSLDGTSNGSGDGVGFTGGDEFHVAKATVTGKSFSGDGVSAGGDLNFEDGEVIGTTDSGNGVSISGKLKVARTTIKGESGGSGTGVKLAGNVEGDSPDSSRIEARSEGGDGVTMADQTEVSLITVSGQANGDGDGIRVDGSISNNGSVLDGNAERGNGISVKPGGAIAGGRVSGFSTKGTGFKAGAGSTLDSVSVTGTTTDGVGADVSGLKEKTGGATVSGEATGHGTSVKTEHSGGGRPDIVPPAPGGDVSPVLPDGELPDDQRGSVQNANAVRQYVYEKQGVLSRPERLMNTVHISGLRERSEPVNVEICTEGQCRQLNVGTVNGPVRQ